MSCATLLASNGEKNSARKFRKCQCVRAHLGRSSMARLADIACMAPVQLVHDSIGRSEILWRACMCKLHAVRPPPARQHLGHMMSTWVQAQLQPGRQGAMPCTALRPDTCSRCKCVLWHDCSRRRGCRPLTRRRGCGRVWRRGGLWVTALWTGRPMQCCRHVTATSSSPCSPPGAYCTHLSPCSSTEYCRLLVGTCRARASLTR